MAKLIVALEEDILKYRKVDAASQSTLKGLIGGLHNYKEIEKLKEECEKNGEKYFKGDNVLIGSIVDTRLLGQEGAYNMKYYNSSLEKVPSDAVIEVAKKFANCIGMPDNFNIDNYEIKIEDFLTNVVPDWRKSRLLPTRISNFKDEAGEYIKELTNSYKKTVVSKKIKDITDETVSSLTSNKRTRKFFSEKSIEYNVELSHVFYQKALYFEHNEVKCKALLDIIEVATDTKYNKVYVKPSDLKITEGKVLEFPYRLRQFRLDIQAAFYSLAIHADENFHKEIFLNEETELIVLPFQFIVESYTHIGEPKILQCTNDIIETGTVGKFTNFSDYPGYTQLLSAYDYYQKTDWKEDIMFCDKDVLNLSFNKIEQWKY